MRTNRPRISPLIEFLESRVFLSVAVLPPVMAAPDFRLFHHDGETSYGSSAPQGGISPAQMRQAYGINGIAFGSVSGTGAGQTIAIVDAYNEPNIASDLANFDSYYGLAAPPSFTALNENGGTTLPPNAQIGGWGIEEALDVEWAHVIAPQANIILYEANSSSDIDLIDAAVVTAESNPNVSVISMSFGGPEFGSESSFDSTFTSNHVTFLAATGDNGLSAAYPSYSPNVIAVGGTTLSVDPSGNWGGETAWSDSSGGTSTDEPEPAYQNSVQNTGNRTAPDVSIDGDPATGVPIYDSYDEGSTTPWVTAGGTSLATPMWSGLIAIADQGRVVNGLSVLDTVSNPSANDKTEALPLLYQAPGSDFHDITSGSNANYSAAPGYDEVTGIGSPVANLLVPFLAGTVAKTPVTVSLSSSSPNPSNATEPVTFTASVSGGVPNGEAITLEDTSNGNKVVATSSLSNGSATLTVPAGTLLAGTHNLVAVYGGDANFAAAQSSAYVQTVQVVVTKVQVNGNIASLIGVQRSMVDSILYTFSERVNISGAAATIAVHSGQIGTVPTLTWTALNPGSDGSSAQWVVTFSGAGVVGNSIANGIYDITLNASAVTSDANPSVAVQSRPTDTFYRLFGDINGDGVVNASDNFQFKAALSTYNAAFDYNDDGAVNAADNFQFKNSMSLSFSNSGVVYTI